MPEGRAQHDFHPTVKLSIHDRTALQEREPTPTRIFRALELTA